MEHATPIASTCGGLLVGLASAMVLYFQGRLTGISGITGGLLTPTKGDTAWRVAFVAGLVATGTVIAWLSPDWVAPGRGSALLFIVAGLLVGFGVRLGNGCTSGHGICGVGRLSRRSMAATATFVAFAMVTVFVRHLIGGQ